MNSFIAYAMDSLLESVQSICDLFLISGKEVTERISSVINDCIEDFHSSCHRAYHGAEDFLEGLAGLLLAPAVLIATIAAIPLLAIVWTGLFLLSAIAHTATVPIVYTWVLYSKIQEAFTSPQESINYFPEILEPTPEPITTFTAPPLLALNALTAIAGMGVEVEVEKEPVVSHWTPSFVPAPITQEEHQAEVLNIQTFRQGLERQFAIKPRQTWKEYILLHLTETSTAQIQSEAERSLPVEVSTALEFPAKPDNKVLQRWDKEQLVTFCDRLNAVKKGSVAKYKNASKTLLIKKIKEFYS
jgi:hypothetical protein